MENKEINRFKQIMGRVGKTYSLVENNTINEEMDGNYDIIEMELSKLMPHNIDFITIPNNIRTISFDKMMHYVSRQIDRQLKKTSSDLYGELEDVMLSSHGDRDMRLFNRAHYNILCKLIFSNKNIVKHIDKNTIPSEAAKFLNTSIREDRDLEYKGVTYSQTHPYGYYEYYSENEGRFIKSDWEGPIHKAIDNDLGEAEEIDYTKSNEMISHFDALDTDVKLELLNRHFPDEKFVASDDMLSLFFMELPYSEKLKVDLDNIVIDEATVNTPTKKVTPQEVAQMLADAIGSDKLLNADVHTLSRDEAEICENLAKKVKYKPKQGNSSMGAIISSRFFIYMQRIYRKMNEANR